MSLSVFDRKYRLNSPSSQSVSRFPSPTSMARGTNLASVDGNFSHTPALLCTLQISIQHSRLLHQAARIKQNREESVILKNQGCL
jgi:hypothetical protein